MKKTVSITALFSLLLVSGLVYSQGPGMGMRKGSGMGMMDSTMHDRMAGHMMARMMASSLVATSDGGVVLLAGNRLYKYDKNLGLTKEAVVKMDTVAMREWKNMMGQ